MCGLEADEVAVTAEHEHLPDIVAALGAYLLKRAGGAERIRQMVIDDIHPNESHLLDGAELFMARSPYRTALCAAIERVRTEEAIRWS
jgi:hypothetical protein